MPRWATRRVLPALTLAVALTGCTSTDTPKLETPSATTDSASPSTAPSPTPSADPRAEPAIAAYRAFFAAGLEAARNPGRLATEPKPGASDFRNYSFDPLRGQYIAFVMGLASDKVAYRGSPPTPRITVSKVDLAAQPYPMVELSNCPTLAPTWTAYSLATGQQIKEASASVPPPYRLRVEVIRYQGRWGVSKITADDTATCTG